MRNFWYDLTKFDNNQFFLYNFVIQTIGQKSFMLALIYCLGLFYDPIKP